MDDIFFYTRFYQLKEENLLFEQWNQRDTTKLFKDNRQQWYLYGIMRARMVDNNTPDWNKARLFEEVVKNIQQQRDACLNPPTVGGGVNSCEVYTHRIIGQSDIYCGAENNIRNTVDASFTDDDGQTRE